MEPNSDRYDTKEAILATVVESQEIVDFLSRQQMEDQEVLDMFFGDGDSDDREEREDFHL